MTKLIAGCFLLAMILCLVSCSNHSPDVSPAEPPKRLRIVSVSGTTTEILCALGMQAELVGTDVTSTYPEYARQLPKVGHSRNASAEAIIALRPDIVVGTAGNLRPELVEQLQQAHIRVLQFQPDPSVDGTKQLIQTVADSMGKGERASDIIHALDKDLAAKVVPRKKVKVLFIYARGAGTMMVAGKQTPADEMIHLAGGENAVQGFEDFKPLTPEALLEANPDVILMFSSGLESLDGIGGLLKVPGVSMTNAGKNRQVIEMDGQLLTGFGPRLGKAVTQLSKELYEVSKH